MTKRKGFMIGILFLGLGATLAATTTIPDYRTRAEEFLNSLTAGKVEPAYTKLLAGSAIMQKKSSVELLQNQTATALKIYGKPLGIEFVKEQRYGDSLVRVVYLLKTEQVPLTWEFYFYKPHSTWTLININFNDEYDLLANK